MQVVVWGSNAYLVQADIDMIKQVSKLILIFRIACKVKINSCPHGAGGRCIQLVCKDARTYGGRLWGGGLPKALVWNWKCPEEICSSISSVKLYIVNVGQPGAKLTSRFGRRGVTFAATRLTFLPLYFNLKDGLFPQSYVLLGAQNRLSYSCDPWTEGCHGGRGACPLLAWGLKTRQHLCSSKREIKFLWSSIAWLKCHFQAIPFADKFIFEDGKHNLHLKYKDQFNALVSDFLAKWFVTICE